jgi:3-deoxy-7-phosphoheptulonate synthase
MVVVMSPDATDEDIAGVVARVEGVGGSAFVSKGVVRTIIGLVGDIESFHHLNLRTLRGVADVHRISDPYKLVSRQHHPDRSTVWVGPPGAQVPIGPETFTLAAGPCAVESAEQTLEAATMARSAGATLLRGGAYKPRTSPYAFQGLGVEGLRILAQVREATGLPVVTEVVDARDVAVVAEHADMLQVATRNTLDISAVPVVQAASHLPVIVDPSHAARRKDLVVPLSRAAIAVGADGVIVDVHPDPETALCDGPQALLGTELRQLAQAVRRLPQALGRRAATVGSRG